MFNLLQATSVTRIIREIVFHNSTTEVGLGIPREVPQSLSDTSHTVRLLWTKIGWSQKILGDKKQHSQKTDFISLEGFKPTILGSKRP
jgi:hypothetical protein